MIDPGSSDCITRHECAEACELHLLCKARDVHKIADGENGVVYSIGISEIDITTDDV